MKLAERFPSLVKILEISAAGFLVLTILLLPVTSLPLLSGWMGGTQVAPPSIITLFAASPFCLTLFLLRRETLPRETLPWLAFAGAGLLSSALAFFLPLPPYRSFTPLDAEIKALLTFAIGAACYIMFSTWFRREGRLVWALRLINIGGILLLTWSFVQLYIILFANGEYPGFMVQIQSWISPGSLKNQVFSMRVTGFALEPSWLAHQLNMVFLPVWLAASVTGYSSFRKVLRVSLENVLLLGGFVILVFTYSRVGLLGILLALAYLVFQVNRAGNRWLRERLVKRGWHSTPWLGFFIGILVLLIYALLVFGLLSFLARTDPRIARLLAFQELPASLLEFAARVDFSERVIYWLNGWQVFARYPLFGVGLGNAGFFFTEHLAPIGRRSYEILQALNQAIFLPNIKSFWIRLLAETGIFGTSLFLGWYILLWSASRRLVRETSILLRTLGWVGSFTLLTFLAEGFSIDSFALPYLWISLGLVTAASALARRKAEQGASG
jgi:hypothetical protein